MEKQDILRLIRGSSRLFLFSLLQIAAQRADIAVTGAYLSDDAVGYWNTAMVLALLPQTLIVPAFYQVLYPLFARYQGEPEKMVRAYRVGTYLLVMLEVPIYAFLMINFTDLTVWVLGPKWAISGELASALCIYCILDPFSIFGSTIIMARKKENHLLIFMLAGLIIIVGFGVWLLPLYNLFGLVLARYAMIIANIFILIPTVREFGSKNVFTFDLVLIYLSVPVIVGISYLFDDPAVRLIVTMAAMGLSMALLSLKILPVAREFLEPALERFIKKEPE